MTKDTTAPTSPEPRVPRFALLDPLHVRFPMPDAAPLDPASFQGDPEKANEQVSDARLMRRIAALAAALDDLPGQARRLARWKARRDAVGAQREESRDSKHGRPYRLSPLKSGRAPGAPPRSLPKARWREEHHVLAETRELAWYALRYPDTS